jgi:hypothetical protein
MRLEVNEWINKSLIPGSHARGQKLEFYPI